MFELDPDHYLPNPGCSWDAMLRFTDVNLKLISDIGKYQFIESTMRGGIFMTCKGCTEANNKFLISYNANKPSSYIIYSDTNNLYGHSISVGRPTEIFDWVNPKNFNLDNCSNDSPIGC